MALHHIGIEVVDLYAVERFYRLALGLTVRYRYISANTPGLRTVMLEGDGVRIELLQRPRPDDFLARRESEKAAVPGHFSIEVDDVDAAHARLAARGLAGAVVRPPRVTGDGLRELELRDPEGNLIELASRVQPEPRHPIRALLFDLDGTLIDSEENYYRADRDLLARYGISFSQQDKRRYVGSANLDMMIDLQRRYALPHTPAELVALKNRIYLEIAESGTRFHDEMKRFWDMARARRMPVAIASGSSPEVLGRLLARIGIEGEPDAVVSAEEVPRGKPAPDVFVEAARRLGVAVTECAAVEDSAYGVEAAHRAFMRCIAVPYLVDKPLAEAFLLADLLFEDGMTAFDADAAMRWVEAANRAAASG
jgi:HAD superfamily hydrolase (TIGR01509 family)